MASPLDQIRTALSIWRKEIDDAAASIPVIGRVFARRWRVLHIEGSGMRYVDGAGGETFIPDTASSDEARESLAKTNTSGPLALRFGTGKGFYRETHFPSAAGPHLLEAAKLALPRLSPLPADDTAFAIASRAPNANEPRIDVTLAIVKKSHIEQAARRAEDMGLSLSAVDLIGDDPLASPTYDLRPGQRPPGTGRSAFRMGAIVAGCLLVISAGLFADVQIRLTPELESLQTPAQIEASLQAAVVQARAKAEAGSATIALSDLSRRLPDGAYITNLTYEGSAIRLTGLAWDAAAALRALDSAPEFVDVTFQDATTRDEDTGRERFQITARHRMIGTDGP